MFNKLSRIVDRLFYPISLAVVALALFLTAFFLSGIDQRYRRFSAAQRLEPGMSPFPYLADLSHSLGSAEYSKRMSGVLWATESGDSEIAVTCHAFASLSNELDIFIITTDSRGVCIDSGPDRVNLVEAESTLIERNGRFARNARFWWALIDNDGDVLYSRSSTVTAQELGRIVELFDSSE